MKKIPSIVLSILMACAMLPIAALPAFADDNTYVMRSWDDEKKQIVEETLPIPADAQKIDSSTIELEGGWYVVEGDVTINENEAISVFETSHIILKDGCTLKCTGIKQRSGVTLYIYGQSGDTGTIYAQSDGDHAGIGGWHVGSNGGEVTIYGGTVNANGNEGAGIGGAWDGDGGTVNIYGGVVNASSGNGAGIGGGALSEDRSSGRPHGGTVNIYGGTVTASGHQGIGFGWEGSLPGDINIYCTYSIKSGSAAPGTETTLDDYISNRNGYVHITTPNLTGSIISEGNILIIGCVAAAAVVCVAAIVIVKKKRA